VKIGLVVNRERDRGMEVAARFISEARSRGIDVFAIKEDTAPELGVEHSPVDSTELVVSVGGDGTVLEAVQHSFASSVPVMGVNLGRVGFLAEIDVAHLPEALDRLKSGDWSISQRMTLKATVDGRTVMHGLNDVVIAKRVTQRLVTLAVAVDGEHFRTYRADGIVIASPTGSTAYGFSAGGPAIEPELELMMMAAVAPHSLFSRALVFGPDRVIQISAVGDRPIGLEVDAADLGELAGGQTVEVTRGDHTVRFATFATHRYPHTLRHKLGLE
jgi:NAD+ kinase